MWVYLKTFLMKISLLKFKMCVLNLHVQLMKNKLKDNEFDNLKL